MNSTPARATTKKAKPATKRWKWLRENGVDPAELSKRGPLTLVFRTEGEDYEESSEVATLEEAVAWFSERMIVGYNDEAIAERIAFEEEESDDAEPWQALLALPPNERPFAAYVVDTLGAREPRDLPSFPEVAEEYPDHVCLCGFTLMGINAYGGVFDAWILARPLANDSRKRLSEYIQEKKAEQNARDVVQTIYETMKSKDDREAIEALLKTTTPTQLDLNGLVKHAVYRDRPLTLGLFLTLFGDRIHPAALLDHAAQGGADGCAELLWPLAAPSDDAAKQTLYQAAVRGNNIWLANKLRAEMAPGTAIAPSMLGVRTPEAFKRVLDAGGDPNEAHPVAKTTVLHFAVEYATSDTRMLDALLSAGVRVDVADFEGTTPLHIAVRRHNVPWIRRLVAAGAPLDAKDSAGRTPEDLARELNHMGALKFVTQK